MRVAGKVIVVIGGGSGIGRALCERFADEGARQVVVADVDQAKAAAVAAQIGGIARGCDVCVESQVRDLISETEDRVGPIDLFCSNAGVLINDPDEKDPASAADASWARTWQVHVMSHVYAARALGPRMVARGHGWFLNTISAAGLLTQMGSAPYSASKHAAVGFAESLAIAYFDRGVRVSILCPQGVETPMVRDAITPAVREGLLSPESVASCVVDGLAQERFLILPHPAVAEYMRRKATDYDRWISGMARLRSLSGA
jgi:NAD(P)-dependent dehydrogenase (short-subunit alcohol dehydrogenase family)